MSNDDEGAEFAYFILLVSHVGKRKGKGYLTRNLVPTEVLPGTLLRQSGGQVEQSKLVLYSIEPDDTVEVTCQKNDVRRLSKTDLRLLAPIPTCAKRLEILKNPDWMNDGRTLCVGDLVEVFIGHGQVEGILRWTGNMPEQKGIIFGVELKSPCGKTNGHLHGKQYFVTRHPKTAIFVPIHKIRKLKSALNTENFTQTKPLQPRSDSCGPDGASKIDCNLSIGEQVVWMSDNGPEFATVKWIGVLPDSQKKDITVGVEFENPVGTGTGKYNNQRLFDAKMKHASLIPLLGLIKAEEYRAQIKDLPDEAEIAVLSNNEFENIPLEVQKKQEQLLIWCTRKAVENDSSPGNQIFDNSAVFSEMVTSSEKDSFKGPNPLYEYEKEQDNNPTNKGTVNREMAVVAPNKHSNEQRDRLDLDPDLVVGSVVEVQINGPQYGLIRWIGKIVNQPKLIAGLEMEEEISCGTDGSFEGGRYFTCGPKKAFFVPLNKCQKDKRFDDQSKVKSVERFGCLQTPDLCGDIAPPQTFCEDMCGKNKGIQGHLNSCYLDTMLYSMFYFTTVMDSIFYHPQREDDNEMYKAVQDTLKNGIVNPLRKLNYVRADKVMKLRFLLDKTGKLPGMMSEEKDPEELLNLLFCTLKADPLLHLSSGEHCHFHQLFVDQKSEIRSPSTQQLFEMSFFQSNIRLLETPTCLILAMPRFGKRYKMYECIIPSLELDITDVLSFGPRECIICGKLAKFECRECYAVHGHGLDTIAFCQECVKTNHQEKNRQTHKPTELEDLEYWKEGTPIPREKMELFAVLCIETSHYVSFVKCGCNVNAPWVFFDSMADRKGGESGYNIPMVKHCPDFSKWIHEGVENRKEMPELKRRLFSDNYMCLYQHRNMMMFR